MSGLSRYNAALYDEATDQARSAPTPTVTGQERTVNLNRYTLTPTDDDGPGVIITHLACSATVAATDTAPGALVSRGQLPGEPTMNDLMVAIYAHRDHCSRD